MTEESVDEGVACSLNDRSLKFIATVQLVANISVSLSKLRTLKFETDHFSVG